MCNLLTAIGLEALYRQAQERVARAGAILSRRDFMGMGFGVLVPPPAFIAMLQKGIPFVMIPAPQPQFPSAMPNGIRPVGRG